MTTTAPAYDQSTAWKPGRPQIRPARLVVSWVLSAVTLIVVSWILPGLTITGFFGALLAAAVIAALNVLLPPIVAGLRLPYTVGLSFLLILILDALLLMLAAEIAPDALSVDNFWWALLAALMMSAVGMILAVATGTNEDDTYTLRLAQRIAKRTGGAIHTDVPGIIFLEIDGLALPVLRRAMRDGNAPQMARWLDDDSHRLVEWETDLSSQTGASQAGILLGSNDDIPAFRWVEKETGRLMTCSAPGDCAEIERRHGNGDGLLVDGGASRGNLLSGEADEVILTVSRMDADKEANPGYRAFFANGMNVTRVLVLYVWEVVLEWIASIRGIRRDVRPRGHRGGSYPFLRAAMCVAVRDLVIFGVLSDMMKGRPAVYATFASLRRGGPPLRPRACGHPRGAAQAGPAVRPRRCAPAATRPAPTRSWSCPTTARPRAPPSSSATATASRTSWSARCARATSPSSPRVTRTTRPWARPCARRPAPPPRTPTRARTSAAPTRSCSGPGTSGLIYLMDVPRRLTLEEIDERHPELIPALRTHPHIGFLLVRSSAHGALALGARGDPPPGQWRGGGRGPPRGLLAHRGPAPAAHRRLRPRRRHHGQQLLRPRARRGLRLRGADLLPRGHGRTADRAVRDAADRTSRCPTRRSSGPRSCTGCSRAGAPCCRVAEPAPPRGPVADCTITWLGHASVLIELDGARLATDPVLTRRLAHLRRMVPPAAVPAGVDAALVSHLHHDHLHRASLRRLDPVRIVAPSGSRGLMPTALRRRLIEVAEGDEVGVEGVRVRAVHARHDDRRSRGRLRAPALGYVVCGSRRIYFPGDTDIFPAMEELATPPLDVALLPVWGWGPSLGPGHLNPFTAAQALTLLRPRIAIPIHWGTYAHAWATPSPALPEAPGRGLRAPRGPARARRRGARCWRPARRSTSPGAPAAEAPRTPGRTPGRRSPAPPRRAAAP